jgi:hypothetical protein
MKEIWQTFKQSWQLWIVIISALVGIGAIQVNFISVKIPQDLAAPFVLGIILIGALIALAISLVQIRGLAKALRESQEKLSKFQGGAPMLFIRDVPIQGLTAHVSRRAGKSRNQVNLELLELSVKVQGFGQKRDAAMYWRFSGINSSNDILTSVQLSIAGETLTPLDELGCAVYDLEKDPSRKNKILPILTGEDSTNKNLLLPFQSPGIEPYKHFDIELSYVWPAIVNIRKDYWFIDPINYASAVNKIRFQFQYDDPIMTAAYAFRLDITTGIAEFQGSIPIEKCEDSQMFLYEVDHPKADVFYVVIIEGNS